MSDDMIRELMEELSTEFDALCQARHEKGQEEYGVFTFLGNDLIRMMAEELADTANYCRYQFIKLMILNTALAEQLTAEGVGDDDGNLTIGLSSFKGTKEGWGNAAGIDSTG